jgi:hypothetical protein
MAPLAYIDVGTGSMILQVIIGGIVAIPFLLRTQVARLGRSVRDRVGRGGAKPVDDVRAE